MRTTYGTVIYLRNLTKLVTYGIAGFFWAFSLIPLANSFEYFAVVCTYLLMVETLMIFVEVVMLFVAFFSPAD